MTTETLQSRVSRNFGDKGPHSHDFKAESLISTVQFCHKCQDTVDMGTSCPIPDPVDITDLGKALEMLRTTWKTATDNYMAGLIQKVMRPEADWPMPDSWIWFYISLAFKDATAAQIWQICCKAVENK